MIRSCLNSWDQHDCETLLVDPRGEVYVVSKVGPGHHGKFVHLPASAWNQHHHVWVSDGVYLPITASSNSPVGGDISPSGTEVRLITSVLYGGIFLPLTLSHSVDMRFLYVCMLTYLCLHAT